MNALIAYLSEDILSFRLASPPPSHSSAAPSPRIGRPASRLRGKDPTLSLKPRVCVRIRVRVRVYLFGCERRERRPACDVNGPFSEGQKSAGGGFGEGTCGEGQNISGESLEISQIRHVSAVRFRAVGLRLCLFLWDVYDHQTHPRSRALGPLHTQVLTKTHINRNGKSGGGQNGEKIPTN